MITRVSESVCGCGAVYESVGVRACALEVVAGSSIAAVIIMVVVEAAFPLYGAKHGTSRG